MKIAILLWIMMIHGTGSGQGNPETFHRFKVELMDFDLIIYHNKDYSKSHYLGSSGSFESPDSTAEDALWYSGFVTNNLHVYSTGNHLMINKKHYLINLPVDELWFVDGKLMDPDKGLVREAKIDKEFESLVDFVSKPIDVRFEGIRFMVKKSLTGSSNLKKVDDDNWELVVGDCFFKMVDGILHIGDMVIGEGLRNSMVTVQENGAILIEKEGRIIKRIDGKP